MTPRAKKVLTLAVAEAKALRHDYVGTEHLLLGLLREEEGIAAMTLKHAERRCKQLELSLYPKVPRIARHCKALLCYTCGWTTYGGAHAHSNLTALCFEAAGSAMRGRGMARTGEQAAETMVNFTMRIPSTMRRQIEALAERDRRKPSDWARVQMEYAIRRELEDDESGDLSHEEVVAEMWARGMITPESEARAAVQTHEDFVRAQQEYEQEQGWR